MSEDYIKGYWATLFKEKGYEPETINVILDYKTTAKVTNSLNLFYEVNYLLNMKELFDEMYIEERLKFIDKSIKLPHFFDNKYKLIINANLLSPPSNGSVMSTKFYILCNLLKDELEKYINNLNLFFYLFTRESSLSSTGVGIPNIIKKYIEELYDVIESFSTERCKKEKRNFLNWVGSRNPIQIRYNEDRTRRIFYDEEDEDAYDITVDERTTELPKAKRRK
jgi:hypothetical protein